MPNTEIKRFVQAELHWLIENPTTSSTAGLTAYRKQEGPNDLFSVYLRFSIKDAVSSHWSEAKIYALAPEMEDRLPIVGDVLVITAGLAPVAEAKILAVGEETF